MLSEAVLNAAGRKRLSSPRHGFSITSISPCPYRTYLSWKASRDPLPSFDKGQPPVSILTMDDGHYQEMSILDWLRDAGYTMAYTGGDQITVHVGKSFIPGHPDGIILTPRMDLLEIKAMNYSRFSDAKKTQLERHQSIRCQVQCYMDSWEFRALGINHTQLFCKHKDSSRSCDFQVDYDPDWVKPIIDVTSAIVSGEFVPEPKECSLCDDCYKYSECHGGLDLSKIKDLDETEFIQIPDIEDQYEKGVALIEQGQYLKDEAREKMIEKLGDKTVVLFDRHKISRIKFPRFSFSKDAFIDLYGPSNLGKVMESKEVVQYRITDL